jgi:hypothetical protein
VVTGYEMVTGYETRLILNFEIIVNLNLLRYWNHMLFFLLPQRRIELITFIVPDNNLLI